MLQPSITTINPGKKKQHLEKHDHTRIRIIVLRLHYRTFKTAGFSEMKKIETTTNNLRSFTTLNVIQ